jgi:hypothetical protein
MSSTPRRKRFNRKQRLQSAKHWIPTYTGKNLVRGYKKWYGVDFICAIKELEMLGFEIDPKYKENILKQKEAQRKAAEKPDKEEHINYDQDVNYYYIAGYTSGGVPYGITWEEYENNIKENEECSEQNVSKKSKQNSEFEVPF